jgi:hypothetical protein
LPYIKSAITQPDVIVFRSDVNTSTTLLLLKHSHHSPWTTHAVDLANKAHPSPAHQERTSRSTAQYINHASRSNTLMYVSRTLRWQRLTANRISSTQRLPPSSQTSKMTICIHHTLNPLHQTFSTTTEGNLQCPACLQHPATKHLTSHGGKMQVFLRRRSAGEHKIALRKFHLDRNSNC